MFAWLKPKSQAERDTEALDKMLSEFRNETSHIDRKWLPGVRQSYADSVARVWRDYLASLEEKYALYKVDKLSKLPADARIKIGNPLGEAVVEKLELCKKLKTKTGPTPEYLDAMTEMYAYKHIGSFVMAASMERYDFAAEYVERLDAYLGDVSGANRNFSVFLKQQGG